MDRQFGYDLGEKLAVGASDEHRKAEKQGIASHWWLETLGSEAGDVKTS
ncbi:hypothetical protein ACFQH2_09480 [Natronoarchaeum sp. GCM10025703]